MYDFYSWYRFICVQTSRVLVWESLRCAVSLIFPHNSPMSLHCKILIFISCLNVHNGALFRALKRQKDYCRLSWQHITAINGPSTPKISKTTKDLLKNVMTTNLSSKHNNNPNVPEPTIISQSLKCPFWTEELEINKGLQGQSFLFSKGNDVDFEHTAC